MPKPTPRTLTHAGRTLTLTQWAAETGVPAETLRSRIDHQGWTVAAALTTPVQSKFKPKRKTPEAPKPCPAYSRHRTGQACARWRSGGKSHIRYFGKWKTPESVAAYRRFQLEWVNLAVADAPRTGDPLTVARLVRLYMEHVRRYYVKDGKPTSEVAGQKAAMRFLLDAAGRELVADIKGRHLKLCQHAMVDAKLVRTTINQNTWRIQRCFRWGVGEDLVPPDVAAVLESVPNLQAGRTTAEDAEPVMSVPWETIEKTLPHLHADPSRRRVLEAMIRFMLVTGMRPGELCAMTRGRIERTPPVWCYRAPNKNLHRESKRRPRLVWVGPKGQELLAPFLADPGPGGTVWVFPPKGNGTRKTAVSRGAFAEFVRLACRRAGVERWHPHRLRHNRATEVQRLYEDDAAAAAAIGDSADVARLVYADPNEAAARRIALATG